MTSLEEMLEELTIWQRVDALPPTPQTVPVVSHCAIDFLRAHAPIVRELINERLAQIRSLN